MNIDSLQRRLTLWKYALFMNLGASITLFIQAVLHYLDSQSLLFPISWYGAWCIVLLASFLPGFVLLWGRHWMQLPLHERLNTIFGYFFMTWFNLSPVGIRFGPGAPVPFNFFFLNFGTKIILK